MMNLNTIKSGWAKAGVVLLLAAPSLTFGEDAFNRYQTSFGTELSRTQGFLGNTSAPVSQADKDNAALNSLLQKLRSNKQIQELSEKKDIWDDITKGYQALDKRGEKRLNDEAKRRIGEDQNIESGVKQLTNSVSPVAPQVAAKMASKDCPTKLNTGEATQVANALQGLDPAAKNAQQNLAQFAQEDEEKANQVFQDGLKAQYLKAVQPPAPQAAPAIPPEVVQAIEQASGGNFNLFAKLMEEEVKKSKNRAEAAKIATAELYLNPETGLLARLNKMKRNDRLVADTVSNMTTFFNGQLATISQSMLQQVEANAETCRYKFDEIQKKKTATVNGMNVANMTGTAFFDQATASAEQGRYNRALRSREDCDIDATQAMGTFNAQTKQAMDQLASETKNPIKVRDNIMNVFSVIANQSVQVAQAHQPVLEACTLAAKTLKKIEQDQTRTQLAQSGQGGAAAAAQQPLPRRQGPQAPANGLASTQQAPGAVHSGQGAQGI